MNDDEQNLEEEVAETGLQRQGASGSLDHMYRDWFLDYASYVILDRAIPNMEDGLKPVQRRILHALYELEDGRYNKAANVIGHTMRYHPHGDMAIGDAFIKMAQKELLVDMQGNWGNLATGDRAAAPRYIEARLSAFAQEILFNEATTTWQPSYDGRNKEPVVLPVKFPLLLALGVEGIAVGLSTKVLPHNFCELIQESIAILRGDRPNLLPDFQSGGVADFTEYQDGKKGGKIRVRAVIEVLDPKTLCVRELPFGVTTTSLIDSVLAANDKGQIKIKKVEDNTAQEVEIVIHLPAGQSPDKAIQALFAFTDCEVSISPNCCVISDGRPQFCGVSHLLRTSTLRTKDLLEQELKIERQRLLDRLHFALLEKIFIEERIYRKIEKCEGWDEVLTTLKKSLKPFHAQFIREPDADDLNKLTEIKIKRITKFDDLRAQENLSKMQEDLKQVEQHLSELTKYAIDYLRGLLKRHGKGRQRRTRIDTFAKVKATTVAVSDQKLYVNRKEGFIGTSLKKDDFVCDCSKLDEVIAFCQDGSFMVSKVSEKTFVGKNIIWVSLFKRNDERRIYHMIYRQGKAGPYYAKRFNVTSITRDKSYPLAKDDAARVLYFSVNPNGEAERVKISLKPSPQVRKTELAFDFATLAVKNRSATGMTVTKHAIAKIVQGVKGASTLAAQRIWFDRSLGLLNSDGQGIYLGKFEGDEKLIAIYQSGTYEILACDLDQQFSDDLIELQKWDPSDTIISTIYYDEQRDDVYVKRIAVDEEQSGCRDYIPRSPGSKVLLATLKSNPVVKAEFAKSKQGAPPSAVIKLAEFIDVKSIKSIGNKLSQHKVAEVRMVRQERS